MKEPGASPLVNGLLAVASILVTLLFFGILEGVLHLAGLGEPDASGASRLKYQQVYLPTLVPGVRRDGAAVLRTDDRRLPFQEVLQEKPANGFRVFVFGGSAAAGLGHSPNVTFARHLERMLGAAFPDRRVEVINLGIVALASKQVALLAAEAARDYAPDALIVYSGNNEFLEPHAEKYAEARANVLTRAKDLLRETHVFRFANRALREEPEVPSLAGHNLSPDDLRLTQARIIEDVTMTPKEIDAVIDRYAANLQEIQAVAQEESVPLVLMTVASNWKWRGRSDLPDGWMDALLGDEAEETSNRLSEARLRVNQELADAAPNERYEWLHKRAKIAEAEEDWEAARENYRASMNEDPHLRRALDRMGRKVIEVADRGSAIPLDTVARLAARADHGIVGFDEFYDYVHFTPRGAVLAGAIVFDGLRESGVLPESTDFDTAEYVRDAFARMDAGGPDAFRLDEWAGIGGDPGDPRSRDLWKYDRAIQEMDARLEANPFDLEALVYRGNASYFEVDGRDDAEAYYLRALAVDPENEDIRSNLERLRFEARP